VIPAQPADAGGPPVFETARKWRHLPASRPSHGAGCARQSPRPPASVRGELLTMASAGADIGPSPEGRTLLVCGEQNGPRPGRRQQQRKRQKSGCLPHRNYDITVNMKTNRMFHIMVIIRGFYIPAHACEIAFAHASAARHPAPCLEVTSVRQMTHIRLSLQLDGSMLRCSKDHLSSGMPGKQILPIGVRNAG
jgi:hypothetical protein